MNFDFSERQIALVNSVQEFIQKECPREYIREVDESREFPEGTWHKIAERGWTRLVIPKGYGGTGEGLVELVIVMEQLAKGFFAVALRLLGNSVFGAHPIISYGSEEQKRYYLPRLAEGEINFACAFTEPSGGTDLLSLSSEAVRDGDGYVLNGHKLFVTMAHWADYILLIAITDKNAAKKTRGLSLLIADARSPGVEIRLLDTMGWKPVGTTEVFLTDVRVSKENLVGELNRGWYHLVESLNWERIVFAAVGVGVARAAFEDALQYSKEKKVLGKPIGQSQVIQQALARMSIDIEGARLLTYKAAWLESRGRQCDMAAAMALSSAATVARDATIEGMRIMGEEGSLMDHDIARYFIAVKPLTVVPLADEMRLNYVAESFGLPVSY